MLNKKALAIMICLLLVGSMWAVDPQKKYVLSLHGTKVNISLQGFLLAKQFKEFEEEYGDDEAYFDIRNNTLTMPLDDLLRGRPWTIRDVKEFVNLAQGTLKCEKISTAHVLSLLQLAHYIGAHIFDGGHRPSRDMVDEVLNELATRIRDKDFVEWLKGKGILWKVLTLNDDLLDQLAHKMFYELLDTPPLLRALSERPGNYFVLSQGTVAHVDDFQKGKKTAITIIDPRTGVTRWQFTCDGNVIGVQSLSGNRLAVVTTGKAVALQILDMKNNGKVLQEVPMKGQWKNSVEFINLIELDNGALVVAVSGENLFILNPRARGFEQRAISLPTDTSWSYIKDIIALSRGRFVTTSFSGDIKLWDVKYKRPVRIYKGDGFALIGIVAVSADQIAFLRSQSKCIFLLDIRKDVITRLIKNTIGQLSDFVLLPEGSVAGVHASSTIHEDLAKIKIFGKHSTHELKTEIASTYVTTKGGRNHIYSFPDGLLVYKNGNVPVVKIWQVTGPKKKYMTFASEVFLKALSVSNMGPQPDYPEHNKKKTLKEVLSFFDKNKPLVFDALVQDERLKKIFISMPETEDVVDVFKKLNIYKRYQAMKQGIVASKGKE